LCCRRLFWIAEPAVWANYRRRPQFDYSVGFWRSVLTAISSKSLSLVGEVQIHLRPIFHGQLADVLYFLLLACEDIQELDQLLSTISFDQCSFIKTHFLSYV
jgi:hypothetical protein